jgi:hypothetical protein
MSSGAGSLLRSGRVSPLVAGADANEGAATDPLVCCLWSVDRYGAIPTDAVVVAVEPDAVNVIVTRSPAAKLVELPLALQLLLPELIAHDVTAVPPFFAKATVHDLPVPPGWTST